MKSGVSIGRPFAVFYSRVLSDLWIIGDMVFPQGNLSVQGRMAYSPSKLQHLHSWNVPRRILSSSAAYTVAFLLSGNHGRDVKLIYCISDLLKNYYQESQSPLCFGFRLLCVVLKHTVLHIIACCIKAVNFIMNMLPSHRNGPNIDMPNFLLAQRTVMSLRALCCAAIHLCQCCIASGYSYPSSCHL